MKTQLCICNNCNAVMIDENPSEQPTFETENLTLVDMAWVNEDGRNEIYWGCPNCLTDGYLMDVEHSEQLDHVKD